MVRPSHSHAPPRVYVAAYVPAIVPNFCITSTCGPCLCIRANGRVVYLYLLFQLHRRFTLCVRLYVQSSRVVWCVGMFMTAQHGSSGRQPNMVIPGDCGRLCWLL